MGGARFIVRSIQVLAHRGANRAVPHGTNKTLQLLGRSKGQVKAEVEAGVATMIDVLRGAKESPLGLRDEETLGITEIQTEGDTDRTLGRNTKEADPPKQRDKEDKTRSKLTKR